MYDGKGLVVVFCALMFAVLGVAATIANTMDRSEQRAHERVMASCTTTIPKTDSARVEQ